GRLDEQHGAVGPAHEGQPRRGAGPVHLPGRSRGREAVRRQVRGDQVTARRLATLALVALVAGLAPAAARAQSKTGTTIGSFLTIEPDARSGGMGNAGASLDQGLEAYYFNPAALAHSDRHGVLLSHVEWIAGIQFDHVVVAVPVGKLGTGALSVTSLRS